MGTCGDCGGSHEAGDSRCPAVTQSADTIVTPGAPVPPTDALLPDLGPKYRPIRLIGRGGMGAVWEAEQVAIGRRVAVKRLAGGHGASRVEWERLRREAEAAGRIGHPNIVRIIDLDVGPDGLPFVVLELLVGEDLRSRLRSRGRLTPDETVAILLEVCSALSAAHARHVLHRDVKPENIYLARGEDGSEVVKLLDFGLARVEDGRTITVDGQFLGTPGYLSPEQVSGAKASPRTDIYGLCLVGYECLCGARPFDAEGIGSTLAAILEKPVPRPTEAGAPAQARVLDEVLLRGLEKDPQDRWASVEDLSRALRAAREGRFLASSVGSALRRRARSRAARMGGVVLLASVAAVAAWFAARPAADTEVPADLELLVERAHKAGMGLAEVRAAETLAREAVRRAPRWAPARIELCHRLVQLSFVAPEGRRAALEEARAQVDRALSDAPDDPAAHHCSGRVHFFSNHDEEALREARWVARRDPSRAGPHEIEARIAWRLGRREALRRAVASCFAAEQRSPVCLQIALRDDLLSEGTSAARRIVDDDESDRAIAISERIRARLLLGRVDEAALLLEGGIEGIGLLDVVDRAWASGMVSWGRGDRPAAARDLAAIEALVAARDLVPHTEAYACWLGAELAAAIGDDVAVVRLARLSVDRGFWNAEYWSRTPAYERVRARGLLDDVVRESRRKGDERWARLRHAGLVQ